jgi:SUKH-3 immunity protein
LETLVTIAAQHPVVRAALEEAGWTDEYRYDTTTLRIALQAEGFSVVAPAVEALTALGGLRVRPPRRADAAFGSGEIVFDPLFAASGEAARIRQRELQLSTALSPIGEWMGEYVLLVAADGAVFAETTFEMLRVGSDLSLALRRLIVAEDQPDRIV